LEFAEDIDRKEYVIRPCSGVRIEVIKGQQVEVIDIDGGQVGDFFAEMKDDTTEFVSPGVVACSVSESSCNSRTCTAVKIAVG